jgi:iron(III) transport system substrate-binding protein
MSRYLAILLLAALVIALPFLFRQPGPETGWKPGDPVLVIITPHNEAIRYEFARGFSAWHHREYGAPVKIDWRAIGGTTEIMRYLVSEYVNAARAWRRGQGEAWPPGAAEAMTSRSLDGDWSAALQAIHRAFRATDDPEQFTCKIDLFFGGGEYDHNQAFRQGLTVAPWPGDPPPDLFTAADGTALIPDGLSGETWRTPTLFGNAVSTIGICYNLDRLRELGVAAPPMQWDDLTDPVYIGQVGVTDPTKSGSIAKAFEMIIQQQCHQAVAAAGFGAEDIGRHERAILEAALPFGVFPEGVPAAYQAAVAAVGRTVSGSSSGSARMRGISPTPRARCRSTSAWATRPSGWQSTSTGATRRNAAAARTARSAWCYAPRSAARASAAIRSACCAARSTARRPCGSSSFVLGEAGQRLWTYRPGTPGGPEKFALRRLPIRRDFYPPWTNHLAFAADDLSAPTVNPYELAKNFTYYSRWTGRHFGILRDLIGPCASTPARNCAPPGRRLCAPAARTRSRGRWPCWAACRTSPNRSPGNPRPRWAPATTGWITGANGRRSFEKATARPGRKRRGRCVTWRASSATRSMPRACSTA